MKKRRLPWEWQEVDGESQTCHAVRHRGTHYRVIISLKRETNKADPDRRSGYHYTLWGVSSTGGLRYSIIGSWVYEWTDLDSLLYEVEAHILSPLEQLASIRDEGEEEGV